MMEVVDLVVQVGKPVNNWFLDIQLVFHIYQMYVSMVTLP